MALYLLHFAFLLTTASGLIVPNSAPSMGHVGHVTKSCNPSHHRNAFISVSHNPCRNRVSLSMVAIESNIIASVFAATVGYIMYQESIEISEKKKEKKAGIPAETREVVEEVKAEGEPEPEEIVEEVKDESDEPEPEEAVKEVKVEPDEPEESMELPTASNAIEESEVLGEVNVEPKEPANLVEPPSAPSIASKVEELESFTDVVAAEMEKIKQVAAESFNRGSDILDIKKSIASTLEGEKEKVDRLEAVSKKNASVEEITQSSDETLQEEIPAIEKDVMKAPVYGRKRRFIKKSLKKILMPWKKWSNL